MLASDSTRAAPHAKRADTRFARLAHRVRRKCANLGPVRWLRSERYLMLHVVDAATARPADPDDGLRCNRLEDLEWFEQTERWLPREAYVAEAKKRIAEGMRLYTKVVDRRLVHYGWLVPGQSRSWFPYVGQHYDYPPGSAVLFNAFTHPVARGSGLHQRSMRRRIADALALPGIERVYTAIESHNAASRAVAARVGFRCVEVLYEKVRLGRVRRGRLDADEYFARVEKDARNR